ncbi:uncharacterized protein ZSWIM9-like isoform X2 [Protopterus annectens]|uniref:uncharacterized protein ZSWIM9-like isoform X2 n=1 Tax=Protopterus annectens TaxID=7888 RepID=UPI001CFB510F|nr:uncharacterized protein ZSWIM9-like isoform X2 [Protopterus annectens]
MRVPQNMGDCLRNKSFSSWEDFCTYFESWCEKNKALFYVQYGRSIYKCRTFDTQYSHEVAETFKYSRVRLVCKEYRADGSFVQLPWGGYKPHCSATITLKLSPLKDRLIVSECLLEHNHILCPIEFSYYFKKGHLFANSCLPVRTANTVSKQFITIQEVKRLLRYCKTPDYGVQDVLKEMEEMFSFDPGAKVKLVFVEHHVIMKCVFFITSHMKSLIERFPETLYCDKQPLGDDFDLHTILCEDSNGRGRVCVYCLAKTGTPDLLRFILVSLIQSIPDIKFKVYCVFVGPETDEIDVIRDVLPVAKVHIYRTQLLEMLYKKAADMEGCLKDDTWELLCRLANSCSVASYVKCLSDLSIVFKNEFVQYLKKVWHPRKEMWVECWAFEQNKGNAFIRFVRSHQQKVIAQLSSSLALADYIHGLRSLQTLNIEVAELNEEELCALYQDVCSSDHASIIREEISLTKNGHYSLQEASVFLLSDGVTEFTINKTQTLCSCKIFTSTLLPCRHLFVVRLWSGEPLFDRQLLLVQQFNSNSSD